jgi:glycosyltransferase involved in cell wall biosynthesis
MATISAVIPVCNGAQLVPEAIASVYEQTVVPDEVIVIDDGSTDDTPAVLRQLGSRLPPSFRWVTQPKSGEARARNRGIELSTGDFVAFLDHDDVWHPDKTRRQLEHFASEPALALSFTAYRLENAIRSEVTIERERWNPDPDAVLSRLIERCRIATPSTVLVRRDALDRVSRFDETVGRGTDWLMWLSVARAGMQIGYLPEVLVEYRPDPSNPSQNLSALSTNACRVTRRFFELDGRPVAYEGRERSAEWWQARHHMLAAIDAIQGGDRVRAKCHILSAARIRPASIRPGWVRMLGIGPVPR